MPLDIPATTLGTGRQTVAAAGARVRLPDLDCRSITIKALHANTGAIYVGSNTVAAANGYPLRADEAVDLAVHNAQDVYIDADVNGEGVAYVWVKGP